MLKETLRDALQLFAMPLLSACLPWRVGFGLLRAFAEAKWIFRQETAQALAGVRTVQPIEDPSAWQSHHRLIRLVDHADLYLSLSRGDRWLDEHIQVTGQWPEKGPFLAAFLHWGAGMWALRHLRRSGRRAAFLSIRFDRAMFRGWPLRYAYARLRAWTTARAAGGGLIFTGGARDAMRDHFAAGGNIVAAIDVPPVGDRDALPVKLFGRPAALTAGIFEVAAQLKVPIVLFTVALNPVDGTRRLDIHPPVVGHNALELAVLFAQRLESALQAASPAWHFWAHVQQFFSSEASTEPVRSLAHADLA